jgi:2,3-bisphosphoglycerate-independent phosphoglycerate mutase
MDKPVVDDFPRGLGSRLLTDIMSRSADWLRDHPVNRARTAAGKRAATHVWLWGVGRAPAFEPFTTKYGTSGTMITAVDLLRGLAALAGWKRLEVPGATGYLDTDYAAKGRAASATRFPAALGVTGSAVRSARGSAGHAATRDPPSAARPAVDRRH